MTKVKIQAEDEKEGTELVLYYPSDLQYFKKGTISGRETLSQIKNILKKNPYAVFTGKIKGEESPASWFELHRDGNPFDHHRLKNIELEGKYITEPLE